MTDPNEPSHWTILSEYSKTVITLASALLAVTVTFAASLMPASASGYITWVLYGIWTLLFAAIVACLLLTAFIFQLLRGQGADYAKRARDAASASYVCVGLAALAFLVLGVLSQNTESDAATSAEAAKEAVVRIDGAQSDQLRVESLHFDSDKRVYTIVVRREKPDQDMVSTVEIDADSNDVLSLESSPE
jgi:hypothetical protein